MDCLPEIHIAAAHGASQKHLESFTPGLGVFCRSGNGVWSVDVGRIRNSERRWANYAAAGWQPIKLPDGIRLGVFGGTINNYSYKQGAYIPMGGGLLTISVNNFVVVLKGIPRVPNMTVAAVAVSIAFKY